MLSLLFLETECQSQKSLPLVKNDVIKYLKNNSTIILYYIKDELGGIKNWFPIKAKEEVVMAKRES